ncbi:Longin-like domain-containing protein [Fimicolochytrium jonesii]|uniref:Longin-like domain-containing protein n=1 Tax=Fimicolochytrium jonesii TaxID=1396493 RepID=UPI0022FE3D6B|nr:Longin-like domain-containing protein [Fimicolochytrium jonesii]KAI8817045.1 Longin-like domain-containing protein [Fimicolochytrium jonesii]
MIQTTIIARVADGYFLAEDTESAELPEMPEFRNQVKVLLKRLSAESPARCSIESGSSVFHYLIEFGVCYLVICDRLYPRKLAFAYLEEMQREFHAQYGDQVGTVARPFAFSKFDPYIQKLKRAYKDSRTQRNLNKLNEDLQDVTRIMTRNIQDVLGRGEALDRMSTTSSRLSQQSKTYLDKTKHLNLQALYQKYGPPVIVLGIVTIVVYLRFWWW